MDWLTAEEAKAIQYEKTHGIAYSHISKEIHDRWVKQGLILIMFDITQHGSFEWTDYCCEFLEFPEDIAEELKRLGYSVNFITRKVLGEDVRYMRVRWS